MKEYECLIQKAKEDNATKLYLDRMDIEDFSLLSSLTNLKELTLRDCENLEDISSLSSLTNLTQLDLYGCDNIKDFSSLCYLSNLGLDDIGFGGLTLPEGFRIDEILPKSSIVEVHYDEQRRAACEMIGWVNIIKELDAKVIDKNPDPEIETLLEIQLLDAEVKDRFLKVRCGTGREFVISVPPNMKTAHQANAWTWGLKPYQYQPEIRT